MVSEISSSDSNKPYRPQFPLNEKVYPTWKKFWENLFHNRQDLSHDDVSKMTDTFLNFISHEMGRVLDHALKVQKAIRKADETGDTPDIS
jgi:hypothetical protein